MEKILQSIPYPTYTTIERDALVDVLLNTKINNSDTGKVEEFDGVSWIEQGSGGTITVDLVPTDGSNNPVASNGVFDALANKVNTSDQTAANVITTPTATLLSTNQEATNAELDSKKANKVLTPTTGNMLKVKADGGIEQSTLTEAGIIAGTVPSVASGEKVVTRTSTAVNVTKDLVEMQIAVGGLAGANWTTGTATFAGIQGQTTYDANYRYECISANTWIRSDRFQTRFELYLADIDDSGGAKTSAQLDAAYPSAFIGQCVWGTTLFRYEKKATNIWKKTSITTA